MKSILLSLSCPNYLSVTYKSSLVVAVPYSSAVVDSLFLARLQTRPAKEAELKQVPHWPFPPKRP